MDVQILGKCNSTSKSKLYIKVNDNEVKCKKYNEKRQAILIKWNVYLNDK